MGGEKAVAYRGGEAEEFENAFKRRARLTSHSKTIKFYLKDDMNSTIPQKKIWVGVPYERKILVYFSYLDGYLSLFIVVISL